MDVKRRGKQVVGGLLMLIGCVVSLSFLRGLAIGHIDNLWKWGLAFSVWNIGRLVLQAALAMYLICSGLRMMNPKLIKPFRFGWGKIIIGSSVLFSQVGSHYHLIAEGPLPRFKPSNPAQAASMEVTGIAISLVFAYLIFRGIRQGFASPESPSESLSVQPPESGQ